MSLRGSSADSSSSWRAEPVGDLVVDLGAEHDDALVQQPGGQLVVERPGVHGRSGAVVMGSPPDSGIRWCPLHGGAPRGRAAPRGSLPTADGGMARERPGVRRSGGPLRGCAHRVPQEVPRQRRHDARPHADSSPSSPSSSRRCPWPRRCRRRPRRSQGPRSPTRSSARPTAPTPRWPTTTATTTTSPRPGSSDVVMRTGAHHLRSAGPRRSRVIGCAPTRRRPCGRHTCRNDQQPVVPVLLRRQGGGAPGHTSPRVPAPTRSGRTPSGATSTSCPTTDGRSTAAVLNSTAPNYMMFSAFTHSDDLQ